MRRKKTPQERGFTLPVKRKLATGRYQKAWAKSLVPDEDEKIPVCFDSGRLSSWRAIVTLEDDRHTVVAEICCECSADLILGEHYLSCSQSEV